MKSHLLVESYICVLAKNINWLNTKSGASPESLTYPLNRILFLEQVDVGYVPLCFYVLLT